MRFLTYLRARRAWLKAARGYALARIEHRRSKSWGETMRREYLNMVKARRKLWVWA